MSTLQQDIHHKIKFRAYVEYEDRMKFIYPQKITFTPSVIYVYDSELDYEHQIEPKYLQQWTGLLDRLGKEIYEGDILDMFPKRKEKIYNHIIFSEGCFCLAEAIMNYELTYGLGDAIVVGNIYQNPELLK